MWQACNTLTLRLRPTGDGRIRVGEMFSGIRTPLPSISAPSLVHWYCTFTWYCAFFPLSQGKTSWLSTTNCLTIFNKCFGASAKKFATAASVCSNWIDHGNEPIFICKQTTLILRSQTISISTTAFHFVINLHWFCGRTFGRSLPQPSLAILLGQQCYMISRPSCSSTCFDWRRNVV